MLDRGPVDLPSLVGDPEECFGVVVLEGLVIAELRAARASVAWLLGAEDVIRPWEIVDIPLARDASWRVLQTTRLLRLDRAFHARARHDPAAIHSLVSGTARTTHWLLAKSLIVSSPVIEERLLLLFALYGERWGKVTTEGVLIHLPLTHELLAALCGARRPSVTHALRSLERKGYIGCPARGTWLLRRLDGGDGLGCWAQYAEALGFDGASKLGSSAA